MTPEIDPKNDPRRYAELVRGRIFILKSKEFEKRKLVEVSPEEEDYLRDKAVDLISLEGEAEHEERCKFSFFDAEGAQKRRTRIDAEDAGEAPPEQNSRIRKATSAGPRVRTRA